MASTSMLMGLPFCDINAAAVGIDDVFGVDETALVLDEPVDAVRLAAFFVGGEREDEIAIGLVAFFLEADEGGDENGIALLHVLRAAAVVVAVFFDELEGIGGPVFTARFHDIEMTDEENRLLLARSVQADDEVLLAVVRAAEEHIFLREAGVEKTLPASLPKRR